MHFVRGPGFWRGAAATEGWWAMRIRLATKISVTIASVVGLAVVTSVLALLSAWHARGLLQETAVEYVPSVREAGEMKAALLKQKGLITSYLLDHGNRTWLRELREIEPEFEQWRVRILTTTHISDEERDLLDRLSATYGELSAKRAEAIRLYQAEKVDEATAILSSDVNTRLYGAVHDLCDQFIQANDQDVETLYTQASSRVRLVTWMVAGSVILTIGLGGALLWFFFHDVIHPLRGMVADARVFHGESDPDQPRSSEDELRQVGEYLRSLMSDVTDTRSHLKRSRVRLAHAEKLASVGKLASFVAHEIRNPLTAVKMWLFSIREAVKADADLDYKCGVVSQEITRLEGIVRNFLEFSRPPALRRQPCDVGPIIDRTLELIGPRIRQRGFRVVRDVPAVLPRVLADADQLKQVLINLLDNAADAMAHDGQIAISAAPERDADGRAMVVVRIRDDGPGMPDEVRERIFEPFFSTKDDGNGLGLCISARIMARHDGLLVLESTNCQGTVFAVWTPTA
jgi:signal transduction histidine kinase